MKTYAIGWCLSALVGFTAVVLGGGCGGDDVIDFGSGGYSETTSTTSGMGGAGGVGGVSVTITAATGASVSSGSSMSSGASTSSGSSMSTGSSTSTASSASSSTGGGSCGPAPNDTPCVTCAKTTCCDDYTKCQGDANCTCWVACLVLDPTNYQGCFTQCGIPDATAQSAGQCLANGCQNECSGGVGSTSSSSASSSSASSSAASSSSASSSSASSSSASSSASSSSSSGSGSSTSASSSSGGALCGPAPGDTACVTCAKQSCCAETTACLGDNNCTCWVTCGQANPNNPAGCLLQCGLPSATTNSLNNCTKQQCQGKCP